MSQPVCVCVCPAVSCPVLLTPGALHGAGQALPKLPLGVVLSQILAPRLIPAFPTPSGAGFVCFSSFPRADLGAAPKPVSTVLQVKGTGLFWPSTGHRPVLDSREIDLRWPWHKQGMHIPTQSRSQPSCKRRLEFQRGRGVGRNSASLPACLSLRLSHLPPAPPPAPGNHGQTVRAVGSSGTGGPGEIKCTIAAEPCLVAFVPWSRAGSWQRS